MNQIKKIIHTDKKWIRQWVMTLSDKNQDIRNIYKKKKVMTVFASQNTVFFILYILNNKYLKIVCGSTPQLVFFVFLLKSTVVLQFFSVRMKCIKERV